MPPSTKESDKKKRKGKCSLPYCVLLFFFLLSLLLFVEVLLIPTCLHGSLFPVVIIFYSLKTSVWLCANILAGVLLFLGEFCYFFFCCSLSPIASPSSILEMFQFVSPLWTIQIMSQFPVYPWLSYLHWHNQK